ncbi:transmembrane protein, putative (macronuclear) [Tetrahymena thermophila SB210]|uniref:Transmembrane protein, putative n=1 Tax=Tetrahymena thermophila (strain SB210) TaxID=312017 RepID=W7XH66_TETTS|nr:transmembrane protein, putative [Tetrahymena thermophila SB210]EWS76508.1 transmembrane protein, putative [Tetrahymena thermophila SB210]|eukprot:XP_012650957.1 transmembrane protein, putative [Tetrahymena thermophila SB210]
MVQEPNEIIYVTKNILSKRNKKLLVIPKIENDLKLQIQNIKKKNILMILIGCILSKFGIILCQQLCSYSQSQVIDQNQSYKFNIIQYFSVLFSQGLLGFTVDLISLSSSWRFTQCVCIIGMLIFILASQSQNSQIIIVANILIRFSQGCNYICGTYILYDSSYYLKKRFLYQSLFILIGSFGGFLIYLILDWLSILNKINQKYLIQVICVCLLINLIGDIIVSQFYNKLDKIKLMSQSYQQYLQSRGVAISLRAIFNYYWNENIIYLAITMISYRSMSSVNNVLFTITNIQQNKQINLSNNLAELLKMLFYLSTITIGIIIMYRIQKRKKVIQFSYQITRNFMVITTIAQILLTATLYFQNKLNLYLIYPLLIIILITKGIAFILSSILCNQLLISLQSEKSSIRCMGIGIFGICQNLFEIFYYLSINPIILNSILSLVGILFLLYSFYYLQNRRFDLIDQKLNQSKLGEPLISVDNSNA